MQINEELRRIAGLVYDELNKEFPMGGGERKVAMGADGDHTREIDRVAENIIFKAIEEMGFEWNLYSEEAGAKNKGEKHTLVVDPIDGTHNAIAGIPFYSTSLALVNEDSGNVEQAVVMNLATGQIYNASMGKGAFRDNRPIKVRSMELEDAVVSSYIGPEARKWAYELMNWPMRTRYFGSISLEVCLVASGSLDMFVMFGRIPRLTDIAASTLILREAGGGSFTMDEGNKISKFRTDFDRNKTKAFFSMGDPISLKRVLEISKLDHEMGDVEK